MGLIINRRLANLDGPCTRQGYMNPTYKRCGSFPGVAGNPAAARAEDPHYRSISQSNAEVVKFITQVDIQTSN